MHTEIRNTIQPQQSTGSVNGRADEDRARVSGPAKERRGPVDVAVVLQRGALEPESKSMVKGRQASGAGREARGIPGVATTEHRRRAGCVLSADLRGYECGDHRCANNHGQEENAGTREPELPPSSPTRPLAFPRAQAPRTLLAKALDPGAIEVDASADGRHARLGLASAPTALSSPRPDRRHDRVTGGDAGDGPIASRHRARRVGLARQRLRPRWSVVRTTGHRIRQARRAVVSGGGATTPR